MMLSGEHVLWNAYLDTSSARAYVPPLAALLAEYAEAFRRMQVALGRALMPAVESAARSMAEFGRAYERAINSTRPRR